MTDIMRTTNGKEIPCKIIKVNPKSMVVRLLEGKEPGRIITVKKHKIISTSS